MHKTGPRAGFWWRFIVCIVKPFLLIFTKRDWRDRQNLPRTGGIVVVANHISHFDPLTLGHFLHEGGRIPRYLAKASLFRIPVFGAIIASAGQIPVQRGSADAAHAFQAAVEAVERGESVVFYPEGTITRDPELWPMTGKTGAARVALLTGRPVIPIAQWGPHEVFPPYQGKKLRSAAAQDDADDGRAAGGSERLPGRAADQYPPAGGHRDDHGRDRRRPRRTARRGTAQGALRPPQGDQMTKIAVFGAGSWGTAFATVLAQAGNDVTIWGRRESVCEAINSRHENDEYLPGDRAARAIARDARPRRRPRTAPRRWCSRCRASRCGRTSPTGPSVLPGRRRC